MSANISLNPLRFTISCLTTGGPATNVTWSKNGNSTLHDQAVEVQTVTSYEDSTYLNEIVLPDDIIAGEYRIDVSNAVSSVSSYFNVSGMGTEAFITVSMILLLSFAQVSLSYTMGTLYQTTPLLTLKPSQRAPFYCAALTRMTAVEVLLPFGGALMENTALMHSA